MARRYLSIALSPEGRSDPDLLLPLLRRTVESACQEAKTEVEIADPFSLAPRQQNRREAVLEEIGRISQQVEIVVAHVDGNGDPDEAVRRHVDPLRTVAENIVPLVPVRETEAWALCDGETLRRVFRVRADDAALGVPPQPVQVEAIADPKAALDRSAELGRNPSRRRGPGARPHFTQLGELLPIDVLERVPSYIAFKTSLADELRRMSVL